MRTFGQFIAEFARDPPRDGPRKPSSEYTYVTMHRPSVSMGVDRWKAISVHRGHIKDLHIPSVATHVGIIHHQHPGSFMHVVRASGGKMTGEHEYDHGAHKLRPSHLDHPDL